MAKKMQPEFTVPPESITKGGSYVVDPAKGTVERKEFTKHEPADLAPVPQPKTDGQVEDVPAAPQSE